MLVDVGYLYLVYPHIRDVCTEPGLFAHLVNLYLGCVPQLSEPGATVDYGQTYVIDSVLNGEKVRHNLRETIIREFGSKNVVPRITVIAAAYEHFCRVVI